MLKKCKIKKILLGVIVTNLLLTACQSEGAMCQEEYERLSVEVENLREEKEQLQTEIIGIKKEHGLEKYIITFKISQSHFTLDISEHIKDSMNDIEIQIPVDKEYYDSLEIGDTVDDSFRIGSLVMKSSWGSWNVKVIDKEIR